MFFFLQLFSSKKLKLEKNLSTLTSAESTILKKHHNMVKKETYKSILKILSCPGISFLFFRFLNRKKIRDKEAVFSNNDHFTKYQKILADKNSNMGQIPDKGMVEDNVNAAKYFQGQTQIQYFNIQKNKDLKKEDRKEILEALQYNISLLNFIINKK